MCYDAPEYAYSITGGSGDGDFIYKNLYSKDDRLTPVFMTKSTTKSASSNQSVNDQPQAEMVAEQGSAEKSEDSIGERSVQGSVGGTEESVEVVSEPNEGQEIDAQAGAVSDKETIESDDQSTVTDEMIEESSVNQESEEAVEKISAENASLEVAAASATETQTDSGASNTGIYVAIIAGLILLVVAGFAIYRTRRS